MLKITSPSPEGPQWFEVWRSSPEYSAMKEELIRLRLMRPVVDSSSSPDGGAFHEGEFVVSFWTQFREVFLRVTKHFWRSPVYIWSKLSVTILFVSLQLTPDPTITRLTLAQSLFIGFSFHADNSLQGLQNQLYSFFMCLLIFNPFSKQIMPMFIPQRALYEVRERPSKIYRWTSKWT